MLTSTHTGKSADEKASPVTTRQKTMSRERLPSRLMMVVGATPTAPFGPHVELPRNHSKRSPDHRLRQGVRRVAGCNDAEGQDVLFCADTTVNICPDPKTLAEIAINTATPFAIWDQPARRHALVIEFGSNRQRAEPAPGGPKHRHRSQAPLPAHGRREMQADVGFCRAARGLVVSDLKGPATFSSSPNLDAGNIAYKLLASFGGAEAVGADSPRMREPVTVLRKQLGRDIVHMAAITVPPTADAPQPGMTLRAISDGREEC